MSAIGSLGVNRAGKLQMLNHTLGRHREKVPDDFADFLFADFSRAGGVNKDGNRLCHADSIRQLDFAGICEACGDDVFCDVTSHIACGPVDFCGVFATEASAAVPSPAAIGVDDDFSACDAAVAFWASDDEPACRVDVKYDVFVNEFIRQDGDDNFLDYLFFEVFVWYVG